MLGDERLLEYSELWNVGAYRERGKWYLNLSGYIKSFDTTEEALAYVRRIRCCN